MRSISYAIFAAFALVSLAPPVLALDPSLRISQFKHTRWSTEDGAPNAILSIIQAPDGFLWLVTNDGTFRFDGLSFERLQMPEFMRGDAITSHIVSADGTLWLGTHNGKIATFRGGRWTDTHMSPGLGPRNQVTSLIQTKDGRIWAAFGRPSDGLAWYGLRGWHLISSSDALPQGFVTALEATPDGKLWVALPGALFVLDRGARRFVKTADAMKGYAAVAADRSGRVWISDDLGTRPSITTTGLTGPTRPYHTPAFKRKPQSFFDRAGSLWGFTPTDGIFRIVQPQLAGPTSKDLERVQRYAETDGLASDSISEGAEDREGNIWVATPLGLERFRSATIAEEPIVGARPEDELPMHVDGRGTVYLAGANGLYRARPNATPELIRRGQFGPGCTSPSGEYWTLPGRSRLIHLENDRFTEKPGPTLPTTMSKLSDGLFGCSWSHDGKLWTAAGDNGFFYLNGGTWHPVKLKDPSLYPAVSVYLDNRARVLAYNHYGELSRIDSLNRRTYIAGGAKAFADITSFSPVDDAILIGSDAGLSKWAAGKLYTILAARSPVIKRVTGIVSANGQTWLQTRVGIACVRTSDLDRAFLDAKAPLPMRIYDFADGLPSLPNTFGFHGLALGGDGRIWITTRGGVAWIDPKRLPFNRYAPPIAIRGVRAGGQAVDPSTKLNLPKGTRDLEVDFAVLSLAIPERNRARYRLIGVDDGWVDAGLRRQAFYTNLAPGTYRFEVTGANNDGVWNQAGANMDVTIPPTFVQSWWFTALIAAALGLLAWAVYSLRVRHIARQIRSRLADRASERERIARELHDTLLQGVQGMLLRFHVATIAIPAGSKAKDDLETALTRGQQIIETARDRVNSLRHLDETTDLGEAIGVAIADLIVPESLVVDVQVDEVSPRLNPLVADELARIASEAVRNAILHADAKRASVRLYEAARLFTLTIADDGVGIPEEILRRGEKAGHFGLIGMRERAGRVGGKFMIRSIPSQGTEVIITVPKWRGSKKRSRWWLRAWTAGAED